MDPVKKALASAGAAAGVGCFQGCGWFHRSGEDLIYRLLWPRDLSFRDGARITRYRSRKTTIPRGQTHWEYIYTYIIYMAVCAVAAADGPPLRFTTFCPPDKSRPFVTPWRVSGASPTGNQGGGCICSRFYFFPSFHPPPTPSSFSFPSSVGSLLFLTPPPTRALKIIRV